ncbi:MAG: UDP-N-acetylmuramoyl-L-alanyl-D-glutamate--2,6-diaminopimelate ligase [Anaerovoracaceae bacterium]|jgi:UDP-N-acetylmuramoyl-L-alanyl-D-glutamate--2,6-diaminopimelate ligase
MKLKNLLLNTGIECPDPWKETDITGICYDSRKIQRGNMFVCLRGRNTDGHIYAGDAAFRGAAVVIAEDTLSLPGTPLLRVKDSRRALAAIAANYYGHPDRYISLYGITGTNGKTTVSYLVKSILEAWGKPCGLTGTISYKVGNREYEAERTTPESLDLQRIFAELKEQGIRCCVMEVSSHALQLGRVQELEFDYSIFTNLSQDHMDFHKDREEYYQIKKKLFSQTSKMGIINTDDDAGKRLLKELRVERIPARCFSLEDSHADYYGEALAMDEKGCRIMFRYNGRDLGELKSCLSGWFSLYNIMAAASCLHSAGAPIEVIQAGIESMKGVPGRFESVKNSKGIPVIVDFAHTPDALENVLITASDMVKGRLLCVFGCGGDRDRSKRPLMGRVAGRYADYCIITSDNPRTESQQQIAADIEEGLYETGCNYEIIDDRRKALQRAISMYRKGDLILVAGKGHENYQIIGSAKYYFSDQETIRELIDKGETGNYGEN